MSRRVYFIKPIGMDGPVKIGCSQSPDGRRATLETWFPFPLEVAAEIDGDLKLEGRFHAKFVGQRTHGEWFSWSSELGDAIKAVAAGTFDIEALPAPIDMRRLYGNYPTGPTDPARKAARAIQRERERLVRVAEHKSGLVCDYPHTAERLDAFIIDPVKHGVTIEARKRGSAERTAAHMRSYLPKEVIAALAEPTPTTSIPHTGIGL